MGDGQFSVLIPMFHITHSGGEERETSTLLSGMSGGVARYEREPYGVAQALDAEKRQLPRRQVAASASLENRAVWVMGSFLY